VGVDGESGIPFESFELLQADTRIQRKTSALVLAIFNLSIYFFPELFFFGKFTA